MANEYFDSTGAPVTNSSVASSPMRNQFNLIETAFNKLPALSGNSSRAVVVKSDASGLTVTVGTLALAGNFATTGAFNTTFIQQATVSLTLPAATAQLATLALAETLSNKVLVGATGTVLGLNVGTAATLTTARSVYGSSFDGSAAIDGPITGTYGGTGVANTGKTITLAGNLITTGAFNTTFAATATATHTLPAGAGTLLSTFAAVTVAQGGTGAATFTAYGVLCGGTTATGAVQSIASVGTSGQVLTSNGAGALPTMQTFASGLVLIATLTASTSVALIDTTSITSAYDLYMIELVDMVPASLSDLRFALSHNGGSTYPSTQSAQITYSNATTVTAVNVNTQAYMALTGSQNIVASPSRGFSAIMFLANPNSAIDKKAWWTGAWDNSSSLVQVSGAGDDTTTSAVNALKVYYASVNMTAGQMRIYGVKTS